MVTLLKNDFKKEESRNIDREIALEKRIKQLDNIVFKRDQSAQTKAQQLEPKLYVGDIIEKTNPIVIPDSEETLLLAEESRSKMLLKQKDPIMFEKKVNTTPVDYAALNQLYKDFETRFVPQTKLSAEQAFWSQNSVNSPEPILSSRPTIVEVPKELPKVSMAVEQHRLESKTFEVKMNQVLNENERLLEQVLSKDIVNIIVNSSVNIASVNVHECEKCLKLETELLKKKDFVEKEIYDKLFKSFTTLEKHCISLEVDTQLNQEIFQRDNSVSNQSAPSFDQLFELNELKAQSQEKDTVIKKLKERINALSGKKNEDKIKQELEEIETINIELDHRVTKLIAENEHLKQTYKQLYDSIKPARIRSKEQCDNLINQVNLKSVEIYDLNASLQEKVLVITDLKDDLRKLKGKALVDNHIAHSAYIKHTQEEATILRDLVEHVKSKYPLDQSLESACRLVPNHPPSTPFVPPSKTNWDLLFQPLFDELLNPPSSVDHPTPEVIGLIAKVVAPEPAVSTDSPSSTTINQDAPSAYNSQTSPETQSLVISNDVVEENYDLDVAHMNNDPFFGILIPENDSEASSSSDVIPTIVHTTTPNSEHITK
ncbi:hypothetical protein Tco_1228408 [Tanacetum coccineum]